MTTHLLQDFKERFFMRLGLKPNWSIGEIKEEFDAAERLINHPTPQKKIVCQNCGKEYTDIDHLSPRRFEGVCEVRVCICGGEIIREIKYKRTTENGRKNRNE